MKISESITVDLTEEEIIEIIKNHIESNSDLVVSTVAFGIPSQYRGLDSMYGGHISGKSGKFNATCKAYRREK